MKAIGGLCTGLQAAFYDKDVAYLLTPPSNKLEEFGGYLAETRNISSDPADASELLGYRMVNEFMKDYLQFEADTIGDLQFTS